MKKFIWLCIPRFAGLIALIAFGINAKAQITLENTYNGANSYSGETYLNVVHLTAGGYKYQLVDKSNKKIKIYNLNHSIYKTINIPPQPLPAAGFEMTYLSDELFNTTPTDVEYMLSNYTSSNVQQITIYDEVGNILFNQDTVNNAITKIVYTSLGAKMILFNPYGDSSGYVYSLPGKLACNDCINGAIGGIAPYDGNGNEITVSNSYPNPAINSTRIDYTFPNGVNQGEIVFYDLQGKEIKRFKVDKTFDHLLISTADIPAGTYFFQLQIPQGGTSGGKKMVVIK